MVPQMPVCPPPPPMAPQVAYQSPQVPQYQPPPVYAPAVPQMQPISIPPPQPAPPTGKKPVIFWVMLLAFGCLFLTAVILVIFFAMKR
jgi:hypothetical protein